MNEIVTDGRSGAKEHSFRAPAGAAPRDLAGRKVRPSNFSTLKVRSQKLKPSSKAVFLEFQHKTQPSRSSQARAAVMTEQTMHSSCSPAHARPLVAMHRVVTARVSVTSRAAAIKVSWSFHAANSLCAGCDKRHLLRLEVVRQVSVVVVDGSGHAYP